ncbi:MAG: hypothetical protein HY673_17140 [Chloroflexi bacterium]|nr:hypothetical protein [Chloroflexota bacterium]
MNDALFIAQVLTTPPLRNDYFELIGGLSGGLSATTGGTATLEVGSSAAPGGSRVLIPLTLKNITSQAGVGVYEIRVTFDPKLVKVESVQPGARPFDRPPVYRIDNGNGLVALAGYHTFAPGVRTDTVVANLVATTLGPAGKTAELKPVVITLSDVLGNAVSAGAVIGNLTAR